MRDKTERLERLVPALSDLLGVTGADRETAARAAHLAKAVLETQWWSR